MGPCKLYLKGILLVKFKGDLKQGSVRGQRKENQKKTCNSFWLKSWGEHKCECFHFGARQSVSQKRLLIKETGSSTFESWFSMQINMFWACLWKEIGSSTFESWSSMQINMFWACLWKEILSCVCFIYCYFFVHHSESAVMYVFSVCIYWYTYNPPATKQNWFFPLCSCWCDPAHWSRQTLVRFCPCTCRPMPSSITCCGPRNWPSSSSCWRPRYTPPGDCMALFWFCIKICYDVETMSCYSKICSVAYLCFVVAQCIAEELHVVSNADVRHCVWNVIRREVLCVMCNADVRYCVWNVIRREVLCVICNADVRHCVWNVIRREVLCVMCNADVRYCVWNVIRWEVLCVICNADVRHCVWNIIRWEGLCVMCNADVRHCVWNVIRWEVLCVIVMQMWDTVCGMQCMCVICNADVRHCVWNVIRREVLCVMCNADVRHCVWNVIKWEVLCVMCNADVRHCVWYAV